MASLQSTTFLNSNAYGSSSSQRRIVRASINLPKLKPISPFSLSNLSTKLANDLELKRTLDLSSNSTYMTKKSSDPMVIKKLYLIMESISDRVEMHKNIGEQRNNWNSLLLISINTITLVAAIMTAMMGSTSVRSDSLIPLKVSSTLMYLSVTAMLSVVNKVQPSQLVEEQRNAARLFKQLQTQIETIIAIEDPNEDDVANAIEKIIALDRAYPLPLLGTMIEKFPSKIQPTTWWPKKNKNHSKFFTKNTSNGNGWDEELEKEMREITKILKLKDEEDYLRLGNKALKLNKGLAIAGPILTGAAAIGAAFAGNYCSWGAAVGVVGGALASVVNTLEHGAQVGMVVEMYRSNAGFFKEVEESIESNLEESDFEMRENGDLFKMKVALQLGRSLSELKNLADVGCEINEFGSKLF